MTVHSLDEVGRLPLPGDNVAITSQRLEAGTGIRCDGDEFVLDCTVMEGHRFAVERIAAGEPLLSWGLPFGVALNDIEPGTYVCNEGMLQALRGRRLDFQLPETFNFEDRIEPYHLDADSFRAGEQVLYVDGRGTFEGYDRAGRGVGTRNYIVVLGTSSRAGSFARALTERLTDVAARDNVDGVVAVAHTEGGGIDRPNNEELLLRTLAGFCVHPNVGALLVVDYGGSEAVANRQLDAYLRNNGYDMDEVPHRFMSIDDSFESKLDEGCRQIRDWLPQVESARRSEQPLSQLKIALQCGGSDAFSGISGNPLAAWVAREVVGRGGTANLAETDELIGAEPYVLANVRDLKTAETFLHMVERFKERAAWHGVSAEGNPSGGNKFRGLYNIVLKSIGAARKRDPEVRLDYAIDYSELMKAPGYYFMDSPGNDLESIAGQVASGSNVIFFVTGNGSITNFPFVPTIKIVTTSTRYELLSRDMDVNAGAYQDGESMDGLGAAMLGLTLEVAGGRRSLGERAGHSQVSIWRNWQQQSDANLETIIAATAPGGEPLAVETVCGPPATFTALRTDSGYAIDQVGLVLPTSLCSGQVARMTAQRLNSEGVGSDKGLSRFVSLVHTEGCGVAMDAEDIQARALVGYLTHPSVRAGLLMEHGCEKTHNDYFRDELSARGVGEERFGWSSVQLDGGIDKVMDHAAAWFATAVESMAPPTYEEVGLAEMRLGLVSAGKPSADVADSFARLSQWIVAAGGSVVVPESGGLLAAAEFTNRLFGSDEAPKPTLAQGQPISAAGFHIMETPVEHWVETITGMGATGVALFLSYAAEHPMQGHPLIPLLQVAEKDSRVGTVYADDLDLLLAEPEDPEAWPNQLLHIVLDVASRRYSPRSVSQGNTDFQLTRGLLGVSL